MLCQRWYLQPFIALGHAAVAEATFHIRSESSGQIAGENTVALTAAERAPDALPAVVSATIYRSRTCGCCGSYISYQIGKFRPDCRRKYCRIDCRGESSRCSASGGICNHLSLSDMRLLRKLHFISDRKVQARLPAKILSH